MHTSKGRDKIFSFVQYLMDLYIKCMAHSSKFHQLVKLDLVPTYIFARKVRKNISSARKVFKFLKFIDEYRSLVELIKKGPSSGEKTDGHVTADQHIKQMSSDDQREKKHVDYESL